MLHIRSSYSRLFVDPHDGYLRWCALTIFSDDGVSVTAPVCIDDVDGFLHRPYHLNTTLQTSILPLHGADIPRLDGEQGRELGARVEGHTSPFEGRGELVEGRGVEDISVD